MDVIEPVRGKHAFLSEDTSILHAADVLFADIKGDPWELFHIHAMGDWNSISTLLQNGIDVFRGSALGD